MPELKVEGTGTFDVEDGRRLVLAIEEDAGVDISTSVGATRTAPPAGSSSSKASPRR